MASKRLATLVSHTQPQKAVGFRDVDEELEAVVCELGGAVPEWVQGTLYRQAGGAYMDDTTILDALAHMVAWRIDSGKVVFTNRFLDSTYRRAFLKGVRSWEATVANKADQSVDKAKINELGSGAVTSINPNVNFWLFDGTTLAAASEFPQGECVLVNPESLESIREIKPLPGSKVFDQKFGLTLTTGAHYFKDPRDTGDYHVSMYLKMNMKGIMETGYRVFKGRNHNKQFETHATIEVSRFDWAKRKTQPPKPADLPSYMHSLGLTDRYIVLAATSKKLDVSTLGPKQGVFFEMFKFMDECPVEIFVVSRETGEVVTRAVAKSPGMMYHVANCYEASPTKVVLDISYGSADNFTHPEKTVMGIMRYEVDVERGTVSENLLKTDVFEFPCCNASFLGRKYRYIFGARKAGEVGKGQFTVGRFDTETGITLGWGVSDEWYASEPVFVPRAGATSELSGVLLVPSINTRQNISALIFIDPATMQEIGRAVNPCMVNFGLHNVYVPSTQDYVVKL